MITKSEREILRDLAAKSTPVVGWYPHGPGDQCGGDEATVRGPFGRWFTVSGGDNGMKDPVKYPVPVAKLYDDAKFAAASMNNLVALLDLIDKLELDNEDLKNLHRKCCL